MATQTGTMGARHLTAALGSGATGSEHAASMSANTTKKYFMLRRYHSFGRAATAMSLEKTVQGQ